MTSHFGPKHFQNFSAFEKVSQKEGERRRLLLKLENFSIRNFCASAIYLLEIENYVVIQTAGLFLGNLHLNQLQVPTVDTYWTKNGDKVQQIRGNEMNNKNIFSICLNFDLYFLVIKELALFKNKIYCAQQNVQKNLYFRQYYIPIIESMHFFYIKTIKTYMGMKYSKF